MWFRVDFSSHVPVYKQIKEKLKLLMLSGELKLGDFVPSIRTLANDLGVNVNTVARAYRELVAEGVLEPVRGEGYVVKWLNLGELVESTLDRFRSTVEECKKVGIEFERLIAIIEEIFGRRDDGSQCEGTNEEL